jgi:anaerobic dimethyl sulfoxide reductase subunit B (iron-sulfur subunit)
MAILGFFFDMARCIGCGACQVACKDTYNLNAGEFYRRVALVSVETAGGKILHPYSGACNHCEKPACVDVCTQKAMYVAPDGTVQHDDDKCVACGACLWNCPYGAVSFSQRKGVTQKCDACAERRAKGKEPACVAACVTGALRFGELETVTQESTTRGPSFLPNPETTQPSVRIRIPDSKEAQ